MPFVYDMYIGKIQLHAKGFSLSRGGGGGGGAHLKIYISVSYMINRENHGLNPNFQKRNFTNLENKFWDNSRTGPTIV